MAGLILIFFILIFIEPHGIDEDEDEENEDESTLPTRHPPQRTDGKNERVEPVVIPELGKVKADGRRLAPRAGFHALDQPLRRRARPPRRARSGRVPRGPALFLPRSTACPRRRPTRHLGFVQRRAIAAPAPPCPGAVRTLGGAARATPRARARCRRVGFSSSGACSLPNQSGTHEPSGRCACWRKRSARSVAWWSTRRCGGGKCGIHALQARSVCAVRSGLLRSNGSAPQPRQNVGIPPSRFCSPRSHCTPACAGRAGR